MRAWLILLPLVIFAEPDTVTLELVSITRIGGGNGFGINCNIGGAASPSLFLFDTGSSGLYAGAPGMGPNIAPSGGHFYQHYSSGIQFCGDNYTAQTIDLGQGAVASSVIFGNIMCAQGDGYTSLCTCTLTPPPSYSCSSPSGSPCFPLTDSPPIYGTFGADISDTGDKYNILAQLPGNLSSGFIVQSNGISGTPMLTIGLTPQNTQGFITAQLPSNGNLQNGLPAWNDKGLYVTTNLSDQGQVQSLTGNIIFDSGATDTELFPNDATVPTPILPIFLSGGQLATGVSIDNVVNDAFNWPNLAGTSTGQNIYYVSGSSPLSGVYINSGIDIYFTYDVMFDITNGLIGFRPIKQFDVSNRPNHSIISTTISNIDSIPTSLVQNGPGNVILTANNTYSNGTILSGGILTIYEDANLGASNGGLTFNGGTLTPAQDYATSRTIAVFSNGGTWNTSAFTSTLSGPLNGTGNLNVSGFGTLIYNGTQGNFFTGTITANIGSTFVVNGNLSSATVNVPGGILTGIGPVNNVNNEGIFNLGLNQFTLVNQYTQFSSGILDIQLASNIAFGQLNIGAQAFLNGTLQIGGVGGFLPNPGDVFTIINGGVIQGNFSQILPLSPTLEVVPLYDPNQVSILINRNYANPQVSMNRNQRAFGEWLNQELIDPSLLEFLNGLSSVNSLLTVYNELIPTQYLSQINSCLFRTTSTFENLEERLRNIWPCGCEDTLIDLEVRGIFQNSSQTHLQSAWFSKGYQIIAEMDHLITRDLKVGLYGDYTCQHISFHPGSIDNHSGTLFGYGSVCHCDWVTDLIVGGSYNFFDNERKLSSFDSIAESKNHSWEIAALFQTGYQVGFLYPYLFVQPVHIFASSFQEHGADDLNMKGKIKPANSVQIGLGVEARANFYIIEEKPSSLEFYGAWHYECIQNRYALTSQFFETSMPFTVVSSHPITNFTSVGADLNLAVAPRIDSHFTYQILFAEKDNWLQSASFGLAFAF